MPNQYQATVLVLAPALNPANPTVPMPDPLPTGVGVVFKADPCPAIVAGFTIISPGVKLGLPNGMIEWLNCSYTRGPFVVPGICKITLKGMP